MLSMLRSRINLCFKFKLVIKLKFRLHNTVDLKVCYSAEFSRPRILISKKLFSRDATFLTVICIMKDNGHTRNKQEKMQVL